MTDDAPSLEEAYPDDYVHTKPLPLEHELEDAEEQYLSGGRYRKTTPHLAKLRRDMFGGYQRDEWPMTEHGNH